MDISADIGLHTRDQGLLVATWQVFEMLDVDGGGELTKATWRCMRRSNPVWQ